MCRAFAEAMYELPAKCLVSNLAGAGVRTISPVNSVNYSALGRPYLSDYFLQVIRGSFGPCGSLVG